jgi:hypothetical protein
MAPEVVRGEALPNIESDLYSLATLLFYMFMLHHPLEGKKEREIKCLDPPAMTRLYGTDPIFIFDPNDRSNAPVAGEQDNAIAFWPIYPQFLRDRFITAFTDGIRNPQNGRVRESQWRGDMVRLRDAIIYCQACARLRCLNLLQNPAEMLHIRRLQNGLERRGGRSCPKLGRLASLVQKLPVRAGARQLNPRECHGFSHIGK